MKAKGFIRTPNGLSIAETRVFFEDTRKIFEEHAQHHYFDLSRNDDGDYQSKTTLMLWAGWCMYHKFNTTEGKISDENKTNDKKTTS